MCTSGTHNPVNGAVTSEYEERQVDRDLTLSELALLQQRRPTWDGGSDPTAVAEKVQAPQRMHSLSDKDCCKLFQSYVVHYSVRICDT